MKFAQWRAWLLTGAFGLAHQLTWAHGGLSIDEDRCKLKVGAYLMHFAGYQPGSSGAKEFCEDIPLVGDTVVTLDAVDEPLRTLPIQVRIVRATGGGGMNNWQDGESVLTLAPKLYPTGSVTFEHHFPEAGQFIGYVSAGERGEHMARFPFTVGAKKSFFVEYGLYLALGLVAIGLLAYTTRSRSRREPSSTD